MQKIQEVQPGHRVRIRSDRPFYVYLMKGEEVTSFVGPHTADLRTTSFTVPKDTTAIMVECDADSLTTIDVVENRYLKADPTSLVQELEHEGPRDLRDIIANTIADYMRQNGQVETEPESIEEANDFEIAGEDWGDEPFAHAHEAMLVKEEYLEPVSEPDPEPAPEPEPEAVADPPAAATG